MKFKIKFLALVLALLCALPACPEEDKLIQGGVEENIILSMTDCVKKALENNPELKAAAGDTKIFESRIGQAKSNYFPRVGINSGYSRNNPLVNTNLQARLDDSYNAYNFSAITLDQLIYDFGKTGDLIKASKLNHESSEKELQALINNITYRTKEAYYLLLYSKKKQQVMQDNVNRLQERLKQATAFFEVGTHAKIDVTIARSNLSNAKLDLIRANNEIDMAVARLNNIMGLPKQAKYSIEDDLSYKKLDISFDKLIDLAYEKRPDLKAAKLRTQASERIVKISKKAVVPNIEASTSYNVGGSDFFDDNGFSVGVNLKLPVTNAYLVKKQLDEAKGRLEKDDAIAHKVENDIYMQTKQACISIIEAEERIPVSEQLLKQANENYDISSARYKAGIGDAIELKDAEVVNKNAQLEYLSSILEYNIAVANLERVLGTGEF